MKTIKLLIIALFVLNNIVLKSQNIYVDARNTSGTTTGTPTYPYTSITEALANAQSGDTIKVAVGTYGNIVIDNKTIVLLGAYSGATSQEYISGNGGNFLIQNYSALTILETSNNNTPVVEIKNSANGTIIDGFNIKGGQRGILFDDVYTWPPLENIEIRNNIIENNGWTELDDNVGGGIKIVGSNISVQNNVIRNNRAGRGGGISTNGDNILIFNNTIDNNIANSDHGGGLYLYGKTNVMNNIISNNQVGYVCGYGWGGGAIFLQTPSNYSISTNNVYFNNYAPTYGGGVFVDEEAFVYMTNDLVYKNYTNDNTHSGAGIAVDQSGNEQSSTLIIKNCTVADNYSLQNKTGNGIFVDENCYVEAKNCIFWNNNGDFKVTQGSILDIVYSICQDEITGNGLIHNNPLFADSPNNDYHLKSKEGRYFQGQWIIDTEHSPAIDAGDPTSNYSLETLPNGGRVNIGAYGNTIQASRSFASSIVSKNSELILVQNPVGDFILLNNAHNFDFIKIINSTGQNIYSEKNEKQNTINCSNWRKGIYVIEFYMNNKKIYSQKIIKN